MAFTERRDEELHSGAVGFDDYPPSAWLPEYFSACEILLEAQGKKLGHLVGAVEANAARKMIAAFHAQVKSEVFKTIADYKTTWELIEPEERERRATAAESQAGAVTC